MVADPADSVCRPNCLSLPTRLTQFASLPTRLTQFASLPTWLTRFAGRQSLNLGPLLGPFLDSLLGPLLGPLLDSLLGPLFRPPFLQYYFTITVTSNMMFTNLLTTFRNRKEHGKIDCEVWQKMVHFVYFV